MAFKFIKQVFKTVFLFSGLFANIIYLPISFADGKLYTVQTNNVQKEITSDFMRDPFLQKMLSNPRLNGVMYLSLEKIDAKTGQISEPAQFMLRGYEWKRGVFMPQYITSAGKTVDLTFPELVHAKDFCNSLMAAASSYLGSKIESIYQYGGATSKVIAVGVGAKEDGISAKDLYYCPNPWSWVAPVPSSLNQKSKYTFDKITFFGDSLTDNGNLYQWMRLPSSPYYYGRFTNGLVWSDTLIMHYNELGIDTQYANFAVGGETIYHHNDQFHLPKTFWNSITDYKTWYLTSDKSIHQNSLFFIWLGANDYVNGVKDAEEETSTAVENLKNGLINLIDLGARQLIVLNLPELSKLPYSRMKNMQKVHEEVTKKHNDKLKAMVDDLRGQYQNAQIELYDTNDPVNKIISGEAGIPLKNTTDSCWTGGYKDNIGDEKPCPNPDEYFFWDILHPTTIVHDYIAKKAIELVEAKFTKKPQ